jgi:hypothetical protein
MEKKSCQDFYYMGRYSALKARMRLIFIDIYSFSVNKIYYIKFSVFERFSILIILKYSVKNLSNLSEIEYRIRRIFFIILFPPFFFE